MSTDGLQMLVALALIVFGATSDHEWGALLSAMGILIAIHEGYRQMGIVRVWSCHFCGKRHSGSIFREVFIPCDHTQDW